MTNLISYGRLIIMKPRIINKTKPTNSMTKATLRRVSLGYTTPNEGGCFIDPIEYIDNQIKYFRKEVKELNKLVDELGEELK